MFSVVILIVEYFVIVMLRVIMLTVVMLFVAYAEFHILVRSVVRESAVMLSVAVKMGIAHQIFGNRKSKNLVQKILATDFYAKVC
jgi:hypothetical protein